MYYNGQVVYHRPTKKPIKMGGEDDGAWAWTGVPYNETIQFIKATSSPGKTDKYEIALPRTVEDAQYLMDIGAIQPAPCGKDTCYVCHVWHGDCKCVKPVLPKY